MNLQITFLVTLDIEVFLGGGDKGENVLLQELNFSASRHLKLLHFIEKEIAAWKRHVISILSETILPGRRDSGVLTCIPIDCTLLYDYHIRFHLQGLSQSLKIKNIPYKFW